LKYRVALERAEQLSGTRVRVIHVVGGGARNELLCQLTADACGRSVAAGPAEATALGNVLVQAMGRGEVKDLAEAHAIARSSAAVRVHEPHSSSDWDERHARLVSPR
jgi:rhamnulokinase